MVGVWYWQKLRGIREASNGVRVRVCIIHGLSLVIKNTYTYCKSLLASKQSTTTHAPRGENGRS